MTALEVITKIQAAVRRADTSDEAEANQAAADALEQFTGEYIEERIHKALRKPVRFGSKKAPPPSEPH